MKGIKKYTFKTLAIFLSILMVIYLVPTFVFAEWIDELTPDKTGDNTDYTGHISETYELTELREENVKHFRQPDGTNVAVVYEYPVHVLDTGLQVLLMVGSSGEYRLRILKLLHGQLRNMIYFALIVPPQLRLSSIFHLQDMNPHIQTR